MTAPFITTRRIRGELRQVRVTVFFKNGKRRERVQVLERKRKQYRPVTREEARQFQQQRSQRARTLDAKRTGKRGRVIADERWVNDPSHYDFKNVDTAGRGQFAGEGTGANIKRREEQEGN